jgi:probable phosphoglycerate mutase
MPVRIDPALRERCFGGFEGLLYAEIEQRYPAEFAAWQARDIDALMPQGARSAESFRQFYQRVLAAILGWAAACPGQSIALVAHGGVLECAYRAATGLPLETPRSFAVLNAGINRFEFDSGALRLTSWGEVAHLAPRTLDELS